VEKIVFVGGDGRDCERRSRGGQGPDYQIRSTGKSGPQANQVHRQIRSTGKSDPQANQIHRQIRSTGKSDPQANQVHGSATFLQTEACQNPQAQHRHRIGIGALKSLLTRMAPCLSCGKTAKCQTATPAGREIPGRKPRTILSNNRKNLRQGPLKPGVLTNTGNFRQITIRSLRYELYHKRDTLNVASTECRLCPRHAPDRMQKRGFHGIGHCEIVAPSAR